MGKPIQITDDGDDDLFYRDAWPDEDIDDLDHCLMGRDGQCGKAGSEECDWICPIGRRFP